MIKRISFTAYMDIDFDDFDEEYREEAKSWKFDDFADTDYDNIERPINSLEAVDWVIMNKKVKTIKE